MVATEFASELFLCQTFLPSPFGQSHCGSPTQSTPQEYVVPSYLVNGLHAFDNVENDGMSYSVLVMRPGNRLREMRKRVGLTQFELAEATGATQTAISNYENGRRPLSLHNLRVFAKALSCTVADLLDPTDNPYALTEEERELVENFRRGDRIQREMVKRVAAPADDREAAA